MVRTCAAPGCKGGYEQESVSVYRFRTEWKKYVPRKNWIPNSNSGLCERHFCPSDYTDERLSDTNVRRKKILGKLKKRRLKPDAVPTVFPNCPSYLTKMRPTERSEKTTSASREKVDKEREALVEKDKLERDKIKTLNELYEKMDINSDLNKCDVTIVKKENMLLFTSISMNNVHQPVNDFCVVIYSDLTFKLWRRNICIDKKGLEVCKDGKVTSCSDVVKLIALVKAVVSNPEVDVVEFCLEILQSLEFNDDSKQRKVTFISEQLKLCITPPHAKKYSSALLACSVLWENSSPSLYKQIISEDVLSLPSVRHIHRLASAISVDTGLTESTMKYLEARLSKLEEREKVVSIVMDEIYTCKRAEYSRSSGKFYGLENQDPTKTLFTIMIKSVASKYQDVIAMIPITTINSSKIFEIFDKVLKGIHEVGFDPVATIVDGHSSNTKFYKELCENSLNKEQCLEKYSENGGEENLDDHKEENENQTTGKEKQETTKGPRNGQGKGRKRKRKSCKTGTKKAKQAKVCLVDCIPNPVNVKSAIFLLYDPVHIFKNIFNNWQRKLKFICPEFGGKPMSANFQHVKDLYNLECGKPIKIAFRLSDRCLNPQPIERVNVDLAARVFDESTVNALRWYSQNGYPEWSSTANFVSLIRRWWLKVNVRTLTAARQKRDADREVISLENLNQLEFFQEFKEFVEKWYKLSGEKGGLSRETYNCLQQYSSAMPKLVKYLLEEKGISYVLTVHLQSDCIEKRFCWYRQSDGGLYHIGVYQVLNAEKKIRMKCLIQHSKFSMSEIKKLSIGGTQADRNKVVIERDSEHLLNELSKEVDEKLDATGDEGIIYYVAGFISKSVMKLEKCEHCINLLVEDRKDQPIVISSDDCEKDQVEKRSEEGFLEMINRGGLCKPSDITFMTCVYAWHHFMRIMDKRKSLFFSFECPRDVFVGSFIKFMFTSESRKAIVSVTCEVKHQYLDLLRKIGVKFFNCIAKNFVTEMNSKIHEEKKRTKKNTGNNTKEKSISKRKISKLNSTT